MAHRILVASYHFPPDAAVGGLRIAKFTRYLSELGWQPYVLTVRDDLRDSGVDPDRMAGLEQIPIVRTKELPRVVEAFIRAASRARRRPVQPVAVAEIPSRPANADESFTSKVVRYVVSLLALLPDEKKNWSLRAALTAPALIRRHRIGWILTSGPPFSGHVIGVAARMLTGVKWAADFRDPWVDMLPDRFPHTRSDMSDAIERWMEAVVVRLADVVVTTTDHMRKAMLDRYPQLPPDKFVCVPNSIDADRLRANRVVDTFERLTITYAGTLYFDRTPEPLFRAVAELIEAGRASATDVKIVLLGQCSQINGVDTASVVRRYGLQDVVEVIERVPYPAAVAMMQQSHLLLVLAPERHRLVVPAKIYDYLGTGSVVMALAEPGATADLMREIQCGPCFSHGDIAGIREYVAGLLDNRRFKHIRNSPEMFARYDARELTSRLAMALERADSRPQREVVVGT